LEPGWFEKVVELSERGITVQARQLEWDDWHGWM
jgi:hypothetical protein